MRRRWCVRQDGRSVKSVVAENGLYLFLIITGIAVQAFVVVQTALAFSRSSHTAVVAACLLTTVVLVFLLILDREKAIRPLPAKSMFLGAAIGFGIAGVVVLALPQVLGTKAEAKSPLRKGANIQVKRPQFKIVEGPGDGIWTGEKDGVIRSIDPSIGEPTGKPIRVGRVLHDIAAFRGFVFATADEGKVVRIDNDPTGEAPLKKKFGEGGGDVTGNGRTLFVSDRSQGVVFRLSLNLKLLATTRINANPNARATAIALGEDGFLWVLDAGLNALYKVSLAKNEVVDSSRIPPGPSELLVVDKKVYIAHPSRGFIEVRSAVDLDPLPGRIPIDPGRTHLATAGGLLIVSSAKSRTLSTISLDTGKPVGTGLPVGVMPTDLDFGHEDSMHGWVTSGQTGNLTPVTVLPKSDWPEACSCSAP